MTKDEVTKALRRAYNLGQIYWQQADSEYMSQHKKADQTEAKFQELLETTVAALEAKDESLVWNGGVPAMLPKQKEGETFIVSYEPKLEAKDEPVAWVCDGEVRSLWWDKNQALDRNAGHEFTPLYATPPQRKPLTDEEITEIFSTTKGLDFYLNFARAIEQAHGIKGEA